MSCNLKQILKAAYFNAAFLFSFAVCAQTQSAYAQAPKTSIENIRAKTAELLAAGKKENAINLLINFSKTERSKSHRPEVSELMFAAGQTFLNKEAQEHYEASLNATLDADRGALKSVEKCLNADEFNVDCRIQKARILYRGGKKNETLEALNAVQALLLNSAYEKVFFLYLERSKPEFRSKSIIGTLPQNPNDKSYVFLSLELERAFLVKNYSRAKEIILHIEKNYSDWPDLAYFRHKLNVESVEDAEEPKDDLMTVYANRCKSISKTVARKYRYDFDLCLRGKNEK